MVFGVGEGEGEGCSVRNLDSFGLLVSSERLKRMTAGVPGLGEWR